MTDYSSATIETETEWIASKWEILFKMWSYVPYFIFSYIGRGLF